MSRRLQAIFAVLHVGGFASRSRHYLRIRSNPQEGLQGWPLDSHAEANETNDEYGFLELWTSHCSREIGKEMASECITLVTWPF